MSCKTLQGKYAEKLEKEKLNMNDKINELYNKLDAQDEIIQQLQLENANLKKDKKKAIEFIENAILETKEVLKDYELHKEHNKILMETLNEDILTMEYILEILGDKENE